MFLKLIDFFSIDMSQSSISWGSCEQQQGSYQLIFVVIHSEIKQFTEPEQTERQKYMAYNRHIY